MIYLKPTGGLCNRMRTIDSMFSLCRIYKTDLTVLWIQDNSLNSPFEEIFETPKFKDFNVKIIDCPLGFPINYPSFPKGNSKFSSVNSILSRQIKNVLKWRLLTSEQQKIRNRLEKLSDSEVIKNEELVEIYSSQDYVQNKTTREMDILFIDKVANKVKLFFEMASKKEAYISSCYRLYKVENNYADFKPTRKIQNRINATTNIFNNTFGLHIRRSDHVTSKNFSTNKKFIELVEQLIKEEFRATFFLSTDDSDTKEELIYRFGDKIITNQVSSYNRNSPDAVKDAVIDLYCLAATKKVYGSHHSSFSQTAADIGQVDEITVR